MGKGRNTGMAVGRMMGLQYALNQKNKDRDFDQHDRNIDLIAQRNKLLENAQNFNQRFNQNFQNFNQNNINRRWQNFLQQQNLENERKNAYDKRNQDLHDRQQTLFNLGIPAAKIQAQNNLNNQRMIQNDMDSVNQHIQEMNPVQKKLHARNLYNTRYGSMLQTAPSHTSSPASGQMMPKPISISDRVKMITPEYMSTFTRQIGYQDYNDAAVNTELANAYAEHISQGGNMTAPEFVTRYAAQNGKYTWDDLNALNEAKQKDLLSGKKNRGYNVWYLPDSNEDNYRQTNEDRYQFQKKMSDNIAAGLSRIYNAKDGKQSAAFNQALKSFATRPELVSRFRIGIYRGMSPEQAVIYADPSIANALNNNK